MTTPTNLKVDGLDFQSIKDNFKTFLRSQDKFKDYNFESSGLNILMDVLSYNTYYNSLYLNMVSNESFLSTAQRRNSVVTAARALNYTPRSISSARVSANLTLQVVGSPASVLIPRYTKFNAATDTGTVSFLNLEPITVVNSSNTFTANNVTLVEGVYVDEKYTKNALDSNQRFIINNSDVDTSTLKVRVQNSSTDSTIRTFSGADSYVNLADNSLVYFLEEVEDGKFEVKFGDGVYGVALQTGNIVLLDYLVSSGPNGNDILFLLYSGSIENVTNILATVNNSGSYGGDERESIEQIKFNAPKSYSSQNRLITPEDYVSLVSRQPNVQSAIVWGGEDNDPPFYGKVFLSIQPKNGEVLTDIEKQNIINYVIKPKKILTIDTEIVDPEYIYLLLEANVKYNSTQNVLSSTNLNSLILDKIIEYKNTDLAQFSRYFRYSKLSRIIDTAERSILSSVLSIRLRKEIAVQLNSSAAYTIDFANPINNITEDRASTHPFNSGNKVVSNQFAYAGYPVCFMEENAGVMRIYRQSGTNFVGLVSNAGTIDYDTGRIVLTAFAPESFADGGTTLKLTAIPREMDVLPLRTQIITIREEDIKINLIDDNVISVTKR